MTEEKTFKVVLGDDNVFEDLGFEAEEAINLKVRADLMLDLRSYIQQRGWTQNEFDSNFSEVRDSITEIRDSIDGLRVTAQALLQVAAQSQCRIDQFDQEIELMKQQHAENDARFNVLLEEVRYLIRGN